MASNSKVACIIPTFGGGKRLIQLLESIAVQTFKVDVLVIDSGSTDGTITFLKKEANRFYEISSNQFNHGGTRQFMIDMHPDYEIYVFLTQDAILESADALRNIVSAFEDQSVGAAYGRQLPHHDAGFFGIQARLFNYPSYSSVKDKRDIERVGIKAAFFSNSFGAYRAAAIKQVGGFPKNVILGEDMYVAAKMILANWKISYCAEATCRHSHDYSVLQELKRYFDVGVFHKMESWIAESFGGAQREGRRFIRFELSEIRNNGVHLFPIWFFRTVAKYVGYKLGLQYKILPKALIVRLSMHYRYWC